MSLDNSQTAVLPSSFDEIKNKRLGVQRAVNAQKRKDVARSVVDALKPSVALGALDFVGNSLLQDKAQHYYKENQRELFKLNQLSQINAASNEVESLRRAGLSTALAGSPSSMSISAVSSPQASTHAPPPSADFGKVDAEKALMAQSVRLSQSEQLVKDAQAGLLQSQKTGQDLENENMFGANYVVQQSWKSMIDNWIADADNRGDDNTIASLEALRDGLTPYLNAGAYQFMQGMLASSGDYASAVHNRLETYLNDLVIGRQVGSNDIIDSLAIAPFLKNQETRAHIVELGSAAVMMMSQAHLNDANAANAVALNPAYKKALDKVLADIRESGVRADQIHNGDLQTAVANGDWGRVASIATEDGLKIAANALGWYLGGRGYAAARAVKKSAPAPAPAPVSDPTPPVYRPNAVGGAARKATEAAAKKAAADDKKAAADVWDNWYSGYRAGSSSPREHQDYPKRRPKTDAYGNKIDYRRKENRGKR